MASDSSSGIANAETNRITVDSVLEALESLKEVNGSSLSSLKKYFTATSPLHLPSNDVSSQIKKALAKGIRDGKIAKFGKSKFSLDLEADGASTKKHRSRRSGDEDEQASPVRRQRSKKRSTRKRSRGRARRRGRSSRRRGKSSKKGRKGKRRRRRRSRRGKKKGSKSKSRKGGRKRRGSRRGGRGRGRGRRR